MLLTEEHIHASVPQSRAERQRYIAAQEKAWLSLSWDRKRFSTEAAQSALTLLSAIAFSDHREPIDLSLLSDDGSSSGASSSRGTKRPASALSPDTDEQQQQPRLPPQNSQSPSQQQSRQQQTQQTNRRPSSSGRPNSSSGSGNAADSATQPKGSSGKEAPSSKEGSKKTSKNGSSKRPKLSGIIPEGTQVACLDRSVNEYWVLGRVVRYLPDMKKYEVLDDADGEEYKYRVFKRNIRVIQKRPTQLDPKKPVLAVYPMTTVFYPAALRNRRGKNWIVEFEDEDDQESNKLKEVDGRFIIQE